MNQNQNKKTLRHFQCRDFLWEIFEQMSAELECSIDYLINEAMRQYARARNYSLQTTGAPQQTSDYMSQGGSMPPRPVGPPSQPAMPVGGPPPSASRQPAPPRPGPPPPVPAPRPRPPQPIPSGGGMAPPRPSAPQTGGFGMAPPVQPQGMPMSQPPPMAGGMQQPSTGRLSLIFNGRKIPITKDQFIIGRGSKTSDLPIKDGNISRKHAAVINHGGVYYIKDLGSTNGIEYNGMRIDNKRVEEGDVFHICDYEIRFTYR
jgi:hypothetical protein